MRRDLGAAGALTLLLGAAIVAAGCTIVQTGPPMPTPSASPTPSPVPPPPPPPPLHAHVLYVLNLHRSSANLSEHYAGLMVAASSLLSELGLDTYRWAIIPTFAGPDGPRILLGGKDPFVEPDLAGVLRDLALSGEYDGEGETAEGKNVVRLGAAVGDLALPPDRGGLERDAFFDGPRNLFIVVYIEPLRRRCAMADDACAVDGRSVAAILTERSADGSAAWLKFGTGSMRPEQIVHVAISTREGESATAFRERCGKLPGFPKNLFDMMEPSANPYFGPLVTELNESAAGTGQQADICELLGGSPEALKAIKKLAIAIASLAR